MLPDALAEAIDRDRAGGVTPIAVVATAGTTLTGAVDPLDAIADVCEARGVWLHVDGAYGLPAAAVRPAELFRGIERADSVLGGRPQVAVPPEGVRRRAGAEPAPRAAFAHEQGYLPHQQHELHAVDITLEYSRPFRALKLWLAHARARRGGSSATRSSATCDEARPALRRRRRRAEDFEVLGRSRSSRSCRSATCRPASSDVERAQRAPSPRRSRPTGASTWRPALIDGDVWLRPCFVNFRTTEDDVLALIEVARELGERLATGGAAA